MAPEKVQDPTNGDFPDAPDNEEDFLKDLQQFYDQRGIQLDLTPKVRNKQISLWELFQNVEGKGGYDRVCELKKEWRRIAVESGLGGANDSGNGFQLKTIYKNNLAAYAIKRVHKQEPPPKEVVEHVTAKGGDLLHRTIENYHVPTMSRVNGGDEDESAEEGTPRAERMEVDDPGSTGRSTRGLRQAPPQRQFFQPDISSSRQSRQVTNQTQSPQPVTQVATHPNVNPNSHSFNVGNYEPRPTFPLTLRPVYTPTNNASTFTDKLERIKNLRNSMQSQQRSQMMAPGTGFEGPNIYQRTLLALKSGIPDEIDYSLNHLVKISHERGDKYRFEPFPGLAESLIEQALLACGLFYEINWEVNYDEFQTDLRPNVLNGHQGTHDILERLSVLKPHAEDPAPAGLMPADYKLRVLRCIEAGLILRNMCMLEDNARYLAEMAPIRDLLCILLNLPQRDYLAELEHYALDICEQLTKYWLVARAQPVYKSLVHFLDRSLGKGDRGSCVTTMRALCRFSINLELQPKIKDIPLLTIERIMNWTMLDDDEIISTSLDFIYQFTSVPENTASLLLAVEGGEPYFRSFLEHLGTLLMHNAVAREEVRVKLPAIPPVTMTSEDIRPMPRDILEDILRFTEPERSSAWLRSLFQERDGADVTQIALWQAYQATFTPFASSDIPQHLQAADFIKNVSSTFPTANAQVIHASQTGGSPRFIIKGITPRYTPVDQNGNRCIRCLWQKPGTSKPCNRFHFAVKSMWEHILVDHVGLEKIDDRLNGDSLSKKVGTEGFTLECHWDGCNHFYRTTRASSKKVSALVNHIMVHLPDRSKKGWEERDKAARASRPSRAMTTRTERVAEDDPEGYPPVYETLTYTDTPVDDRGEPVGIALTSLLVLKNVARNIPKAVDSSKGEELKMETANGENGWMSRLFGPIRERLVHVAAYNRPLANPVLDLISFIDGCVDQRD